MFRRHLHDTKVYADRGTPYPCTQAELDILQDQRRKPVHRGPYISRHEAAERLQQAHDPHTPLTDAQKAALKRLNDLQQLRRWGPDIISKMFNDLDLLLFRGKLRGNVYLRWNDHDKNLNAGGKALAWTVRARGISPRVAIEMGVFSATLPTVGLRDILSTLVHEMVHAYLLSLTDNDEGPSDKETGGHGNCFHKCAGAVMMRLGGKEGGFKEIRGCPDIFGRRPGARKWKSGFRFVGL